MEQTIRQMVDGYQTRVKNHDLQPAEAVEILKDLASIMGNINDKILETEIAYNITLKQALDANEKANRAIIIAKCSPQYEYMMQARNTEKEVKMLISSLNRFLRVKEDEMRSLKFQ